MYSLCNYKHILVISWLLRRSFSHSMYLLHLLVQICRSLVTAAVSAGARQQRGCRPKQRPGPLLACSPHAGQPILQPVSIILCFIYSWLESSGQEYASFICCYCCNLSLIKVPMTSSLPECVCVFWPLLLMVTSLVCLWVRRPPLCVAATEWRSTVGTIILIYSQQYPPHSQSTPCWH